MLFKKAKLKKFINKNKKINPYICIAGKNQCSIDCLKIVMKCFNKKQILVLPNNDDKGVDDWQPSLKKFANKNKIRVIKLQNLYKIRYLYFFSVEYTKIININKFITKNLFNIHFSLLPKYRGCHTNYFQVRNNEKRSGVTIHLIDNGIDTGDIIDQASYMTNINDTAYQNYLKLMKYTKQIFKKNFTNIIRSKFIRKKQILSKGMYFSRKSVDYNKEKNINLNKLTLSMHNKIRSLIFPAFQLPIVNKKIVVKSIYKNKKISLKYL